MADTDKFNKEGGRCVNCNVAPDDFEKGHSYTETERGIEYDVEHLNDLGMLEANGISLTFDRMNNRLIIERDEMTLEDITEELEKLVDDND